MTRFTKNAARLTVALALSLISFVPASADPGKRLYQPISHRVDVDIRSLEATYTPRGFSSGVEVSYRVRAEDVRRGQSFNLQVSVIDCGRTVQTMLVPLGRGVSCGRDEIEFRGCVTIPAGRGFGQSSGRMSVVASVVDSCTGRLFETEQASIRICGPDIRGREVPRHDDHGRGHNSRGSSWGR